MDIKAIINKNKITPLSIFLFITSFVVGLFNEPSGAVCTILLSIMLLAEIIRKKRFSISISVSSIAIALIPLSMLFTSLWAVDKYYSILGFVKFLPLLLLWLHLCQFDRDYVQGAIGFVPLSGAVMTVVSLVFSRIPTVSELFSINARISGFFQYSNTFALFLIIGLIILSKSEYSNKYSLPMSVLLVFGVFMTGSRSSFVIMLVAFVGIIIISDKKPLKIGIVAGTAVIVIIAIVLYLVTGKHGAIGRFMTFSLSAGTLQGRLLYFKDALRCIVKHPFGLGYMGYYFAQGSFQTGVYDNQFVHNELLQIMLDIGWIPAVVCVICGIKAIFGKTQPKENRLAVFVILLHSMLDFDLQFLTISFVLLLLIYDDGKNKEIVLKKPIKALMSIVLALACVLSVYMGLSSGLYLMSRSDLAVRICKYNTMAQIDELREQQDIPSKKEIADCILKNNKYVSNAYSAIAQYYYSNGDIEETIEYKKLAISHNRYFTEEYRDYCSMLLSVMSTYYEMGEDEGVQYCYAEIIDLQDYMDEVIEQTDPIAYKITDKPDISLTDEQKQIILELNN